MLTIYHSPVYLFLVYSIGSNGILAGVFPQESCLWLSESPIYGHCAYLSWLVVEPTPLKNMSLSVGIMTLEK